jgi:aquaporin Z
MEMSRKLVAEAFGTFWLVFGGCGAAVLAANFPGSGPENSLGLGFLGVSFAFGLTVLTMAYAVGHISGGHFNPAVTIGLWAAKRFPSKEVLPYVVVQVIGAIAAAAVLFAVAKSVTGGYEIDNSQAGAFAANGYGDLSPGGYKVGGALIIEVLLTFGFLFVILGATARKAHAVSGPMAIGFALVLIHLISIPVTNTSVNPARSTGPALFAGGDYIPQLWLFWLAPLVGAAIAGGVWRFLSPEDARLEDIPEEAKAY